MKNLLGVTTSSITQTQMTRVHGNRSDECQNHAYEETESCESKRTSRLVRNPKLTARTRRRTKQRVENETNKAKIETKKGSEKQCFTLRNILNEGKAQSQVYVEAHHEGVQDCEVRGQGNFEWNTDLIETKRTTPSRLHKTCSMERHNTNLEDLTEDNTAHRFTKHQNGLRTQSLCKEIWTSKPGWYERLTTESL